MIQMTSKIIHQKDGCFYEKINSDKEMEYVGMPYDTNNLYIIVIQEHHINSIQVPNGIFRSEMIFHMET